MNDTVKYKVTGVLVNGKRFKAIHTTNYWQAAGINLYRGTMWESRNDGPWVIIKRVRN